MPRNGEQLILRNIKLQSVVAENSALHIRKRIAKYIARIFDDGALKKAMSGYVLTRASKLVNGARRIPSTLPTISENIRESTGSGTHTAACVITTDSPTNKHVTFTRVSRQVHARFVESLDRCIQTTITQLVNFVVYCADIATSALVISAITQSYSRQQLNISMGVRICLL